MRRNPGILGVWRFAFVLLLAASGPLGGSPRAFAQTSDKSSVPSTESQTPFQLKARSNLVVVRVVVRDAEGKPVAGLQKEDFRVLDRGKEQSISQFEVQTSTPLPSTASPSTSTTVDAQPGQVAPPPPPTTMPAKFLALYFDDLDTSDPDMIYVRQATEHYLAANLQPKERVAIFTSEKMLSDFTADPQQIHVAVTKLQASARSMSRMHDCPDISDYQALEITQQENPESSDAWQKALDEAMSRCKMGTPTFGLAGESDEDPAKSQAELVGTIRMMARKTLFQAEMQARSNLLQLDHLVNYISQMPGQRTIVLVSPGFLSESEQYQLDRTIDRAVRSQVVISSLDPKGLAVLMQEADASRTYPYGRPGSTDRLDSQRELVAADVLAQVAQDTGGEFFHNNNDLKAGLAALGGSPVSYVLAFAPSDIKPDGKFHGLKVNLVEKHKGLSVQARRGYFAPRNEADAEAEAKRQAAFDAESQSQEQIREAILSKTDSQQLPVGLGGKLADAQGGARQLSLVAHLDAKPLHFRKEGEHNLNTVTFVFAIFDQKENLVTSQQRQAFVSVLDAQLPDLFKEGVDMNMNFQLKPGIYRIREVVTDSEEHHLSALSRQIEVP